MPVDYFIGILGNPRLPLPSEHHSVSADLEGRTCLDARNTFWAFNAAAKYAGCPPAAIFSRGVLKCICICEVLLMRFEWDDDKNRRNLAKHKFSFETARLVFDDPQVRSIQDRVVEGEERWQTIGMVSGTVLLVAHTYRGEAGDEVIRLISARKAVAHERRAYEKSRKRSSE